MSDEKKEGFENEEFDSNSDDSFMLEDEKDYPGEMPAFRAEQKKKKKRSGMLIFFSVIASIVLLFFVSISAYLLLFHTDDTMDLLGFGEKEDVQIEEVADNTEKLKPIEEEPKVDETETAETEVVESTDETKIKESDEKLIPLVKDSKSDVKKETIVEKPKTSVKPTIKKAPTKVVDKKKTVAPKNDLASTPKSVAKKKTESKKIEHKKTVTKVVQNEPVKKKNEQKKTTSVEKVKKADSKLKTVDVAESRPKKDRTTKYKSARKNTLGSIKEQKNSVTKSGKDLYTIQIYSSPSREDAEEWLDKLKARNIADAFISQQKIRDNMWYRVRFGKFSSREEARTIALKHGFTQTWIDKVR